MIGTIDSLVEKASNRWRWLLSASLYTVACLSSAALLGTLLGAIGRIGQDIVCAAALTAF